MITLIAEMSFCSEYVMMYSGILLGWEVYLELSQLQLCRKSSAFSCAKVILDGDGWYTQQAK